MWIETIPVSLLTGIGMLGTFVFWIYVYRFTPDENKKEWFFGGIVMAFLSMLILLGYLWNAYQR